ncbi:MAG: TolC family protein [Myxococcales bacterium]|nr:TolC family protein [Myxococcales bacterium]
MSKERKQSTEAAVREIRRRTRRKFSPNMNSDAGDKGLTFVLAALALSCRLDQYARGGMIRDKVFRASRVSTTAFLGLATALALGCATASERAAVAQLDDWLARKPLEQSKSVLPSEAGLADFERLAFENSPILRAAYERWRSQVSAIALVRALPDPTLGLGIFAREVETRVGPQQARFAFEQRIPWLSKLTLAGDVRALAAQAAFAEAESLRLELRVRIRSIWGELYYLGKRIDITSDNVELVRQWEQSARARYQSSLLSYRDIARAQIELGILEDDLARLHLRRRPLITRLLAIIGADLRSPVSIPKELQEIEPLPDDAELRTRLQQFNPELTALSHLADSARIDVARARTRYLPDFRVGLAYTLTGSADMPGVSGSGKDAVVPQLSFSVPIWWGAYAAGVESAAASQRAANEGVRGQRLVLEAELEDDLFSLRDAQRRQVLYHDDILPKARENLESTTASYRSGRAALIDLIDAQRTLLEFELAFERARTDAFIAAAKVRALIGGA